MARLLLLLLFMIVLPASQVCRAQTASEILEQTSQAMEPPIIFRLNVNGKSCLVSKKKLDDESVGTRIEFAGPSSLVRIETASASYEIYPNSKTAIDLGFMGVASNSRLSDVLGLVGGSGRPNASEELQLTSETEFEGKQCWKITQSVADNTSSATPSQAADEVVTARTSSETVYYIEKQSYQLVCLESFSNTGQRILRTKISDVERPIDISNNRFAPPADFAIQKPQSIVEYVSARESLIVTQDLKDRMNAIQTRAANRQAQSAAMLASINANANAARKTSARMTYFIPILSVCMFVFFLVVTTMGHGRMTNKWKQMKNDPASAQAEITKMMEAANVSSWTRFTRAPLVLKAFVIYAACAMVVGLALPFFLPIGTYSIAGGMRFMIPLMLLHTALSRLEFRRSIYAVAALLVFYGAINIFQLNTFQLIRSILPNRSRSALLALLESVMPIVWAMLLMSPSMQKWIRAKSDDEVRVNQISTADLLYFMFVASLASIAVFRMLLSFEAPLSTAVAVV